MIEYCKLSEQVSFIEELRQQSIDVVLPNAKVNFYLSEVSYNIINEIKELFIENGYVIVRDFSSESDDAIKLVRSLSNRLFYQGSELKYVYQFETEPFQSEILSSSLGCGAFHTDFWTVEESPNYIMLQCVEPDPRHPFYSRNQVVMVSELLNMLEQLIPGIIKVLVDLLVPHRIGEKVIWVKLLSQSEGGWVIRFHPKYVDENELKSEHFFKGIPIHNLISDVAHSIADDFVLNSKDVLIVSNKFCLHRRGESTVVFDKELSNWRGRKLNTLRFF